jgi:hypothetical protein
VALAQPLTIDQGADWPGTRFWIVDAAGNPKLLGTPMSAYGLIVDPTTGEMVFEWSSDPTAEQGRIFWQGSTLIPTCTAAQNRLWTFRAAPYALYLTDPAAPPADRTILVSRDTVYLTRALG